MKVIIEREFNYQITPQAVMHLTPHPEPVTVKREIGEAAMFAGCAVEVLKQDATSLEKPAKSVGNGKAAKLATDSILDRGDSDADRGAEVRVQGAIGASE